MTETISDVEKLETQINQLKEAVAVMENRQRAAPGIEPEEISKVMFHKMDEDEPVHPRLREILNNHVDLDQVKRSLKRMENDLNDLRNIGDPKELYDPFEHEMNGSTEDEYEDKNLDITNDEDGQENPAQLRDEEQRPLSAYSHPKDSE